jgi:energy-converting hydrogenase Eha subunit A/predicted outer membrane lipoprotein
MESFYAGAGTTSEREVLRTHKAREKHTGINELIRADVMSWLLRRYSLGQACRLLWGRLSRREWVGLALAVIATLFALARFFSQTTPRGQVGAQIVAFVALIGLAPRIFSLMLPRAMFGTLLAWITVVLAQSASLLPIVSEDKGIHNACHLWLRSVIHPGPRVYEWMAAIVHSRTLFVTPPELADFVIVVGGCLAVSLVFLMVEVSNRLATRIVGRSILCVAVMLGGSLFWGAMFVPALEYIVVRNDVAGCDCMYPAWILGSVSAVVFGILVQLMWDDRAVSDSIGPVADARLR